MSTGGTNFGETSAWLRGLLLIISIGLIAAAPPGVTNQVPAQNPPPAAAGSVMDAPLRLVSELSILTKACAIIRVCL